MPPSASTLPPYFRGVALSLICLVLLGVMPIVANSRPGAFPALQFAFWLSAWQTLFALPHLVVERARTSGPARRPPLAPRARIVLIGTGMVFGLSTYLYVLGVEKAGAVNAAIAIQAYPIFAIGLETVFLKRRKTRLELAFTALILVSLVYLGTGGTMRLAGLSPWFFVTLAVPLLWAVAHVTIREALSRQEITPAQITFARVLVSTCFLAALVVLNGPLTLLEGLFRPEFQIFAALMGLIYYLELIVWFMAIRHIDVSVASSLTAPWPAITMVLTATLFGMALQTWQFVAFFLVVAGIYGLLLEGRRRAT